VRNKSYQGFYCRTGLWQDASHAHDPHPTIHLFFVHRTDVSLTGYANRIVPGLAAANLVVLALTMSGFQLSRQRSAADFQAGIRSIEGYVEDPSQLHVVIGRYIGSETHGDSDYRCYYFQALDASDRIPEWVVPPDDINTAAYIRHASQTYCNA